MSASLLALPVVLASLAGTSLLAPRLRVPQPLAVAVAGVGLGFLPGLCAIEVGPEVILAGFLPPLLYADAWETSWRDFRRWLRPILMLAIGLVAVTILAVGLVAKWMLPELPWAVCFLLGAIVSPTDTVAVQAVIERLRVPRRFTAIVGGESLVNDATGLVGVQVGVVVVLQSTFAVGQIALQFAWVAGAGMLIGALVGVLFTFAHRLVREVGVLFMLSLLSPYLAFSLASLAGASGVLAVVVAGGVVSWRVHLIPAAARVQLRASWQQLTFLLNGLCFLYVGLQSQQLWREHRTDADQHSLLLAGCAIAATVIAARIVWCWPAAYLPLWLSPRVREREGGYPRPQGVLLASWCGVRGAVSLAAALAVPMTIGPEGPEFPGRNEIVACTVAVILLTLFLQGGTLLPLVRMLGMSDDGTTDNEMRKARERMLQAGIGRLDAFCSERSCPVAVHRLREAMADELGSFQADDEAERARARQRRAVSREVRAAVGQAQELALLRLRDSGAIDDRAYNQLLTELDEELLGEIDAT
jgi:CPA1 family monovalent cation:H+ antiporter